MTPALNYNDARAFLAALDVPGASFAFRTFADGERGRGALTRNFFGTFDQHAESLRRLNVAGAGIFVTINETDGEGISADHVRRVRALFVDLDGAPVEPVLKFRPPPHVLTETSPGRYHAFWRIDGMVLDLFRSMQQDMASHFGADPTVCDLPRVMRLAGFVNHKHGSPHLVRIVRVLDRPPLSSDALNRLAAVTEGRDRWRGTSMDGPTGFAPPLDSAIRSPGRHAALVSLAATLGARGVCRQAIVDCLHSVNAHQCSPPLDGARLTEIDAIAEWGARRLVLSPLGEPDDLNDVADMSDDELAAIIREIRQ